MHRIALLRVGSLCLVALISSASYGGHAYARYENTQDCNANGIDDSDDILSGFSLDCDLNGVPDECQANCDANDNAILDICELDNSLSLNCELIVHYELNGDCVDSGPNIGLGLDGVPVGPTPLVTTNRYGDPFGACEFAGGHFEIPDDDILTFGDEPFSVSLWVRGPVTTTTRNQQLLGHSNGRNEVPKWHLDVSANRVRLHVNDAGFDGGGEYPVTATSSVFATSAWVHVALRRTGSEYDLFFDGALMASGIWVGTMPDPTSPFRIGKAEGPSFTGALDNVRLYSRALTDSEIAHLFFSDCNANGQTDEADIVFGTSQDCNADGVPDDCQLLDNDCNSDGVPDECDTDCNANDIPDDCDTDCNANDIPDDCDIANGTSQDCNSDGVPDECQLLDNDCNSDGVPNECQLLGNDCNSNDVPDDCDIAEGTSQDEFPIDGLPDECRSPYDDTCFVATAAYGNYDSAEVRVLRRFRDRSLRHHALGRAFIELYYEHSPALAAAIAERFWARSLSRFALAPLVASAYLHLELPWLMPLVLLLLLGHIESRDKKGKIGAPHQ